MPQTQRPDPNESSQQMLEDLNPTQRAQVWNLVVRELREAEVAIRAASSVAGGGKGPEDPIIRASLWLLEGMRRVVNETMKELADRDALSRRRAEEAEWRSEGGEVSGSQTR